MDWKSALSYIVPLAAVALSYVFGRIQSENKYKREQLQKRYDGLYVPIIQKLYGSFIWENKYSQMKLEGRGIFFDLIMNNLEYADISAHKQIPAFYKAFLDMLEFEDGNEQYKFAPKEIDIAFYGVISSLLVQSIKLSRSLRLPPIGETILTLLNQSNSWKEESTSAEH